MSARNKNLSKKFSHNNRVYFIICASLGNRGFSFITLSINEDVYDVLFEEIHIGRIT